MALAEMVVERFRSGRRRRDRAVQPAVDGRRPSHLRPARVPPRPRARLVAGTRRPADRLPPGALMEATLTFTVTDADTAEAVGSGSLPVLGTPRLLAWCEAATCAAIDPTLEAGLDQRRHPGHPGASRREPGRPAGRGHRLRGVRRRPAAPLHRRRPQRRRRRSAGQGGRLRRDHPGGRRRPRSSSPAGNADPSEDLLTGHPIWYRGGTWEDDSISIQEEHHGQDRPQAPFAS